MYQQWSQIFENDKTENALPPHKSWDHEIFLKLKKKPTFEPIWFMSEEKLKVMQDYLHLNLKK